MRPEQLAAAELVAVYGYGREGQSLVSYVSEHAPGAQLVVVQDGPPSDELTDASRRLGFEVVTGTDEVAAALCDRPFDVVLRSPGVSIHHGPLAAAIDAGRRVTTSLNLWLARHRPDNVIGITGTKGKSTTTTVVAHLLRKAGRRILLAGNIGTPVLDLDASPDDVDLVVLELSSYQLADLDGQLRVGVLLNLHPEHLDWHGTHERYMADKCRITALSRTLVANRDDGDVVDRTGDHDDLRWFGVGAETVTVGAQTLARDELVDALAASKLTGSHQQYNVAAALTALAEVGIEPTDALPWLADVEPLPHRLQLVADDGRQWVDDSISTIPEAAVAALRAFAGMPVTLLAGGFDRSQDHAVLVDAIRDHGDVRVVAMPDTGRRLAAAVREQLPDTAVDEVEDLQAAVTRAAATTPAGGVVLLSPAAPSYGFFTSFEERGDRFAALAAAVGDSA